MNNSNKPQLRIVRQIAAPMALVFDAFTKAEHLKHWWGPAGCKIEILSLEAKPGGTFHYAMHFPGGDTMYGLFQFKEINPPHKLVFVNSFADTEGHITAVPGLEDFPKEILNTWHFSESDGITTLILEATPVSQLAHELNAFEDLHDDMNSGYNNSFDVLVEYLKTGAQIRQAMKTTNQARVCTYLNFPGNTEEAFTFYKTVFRTEFGGKGLQRFGDAPLPDGHPPLSESEQKLIIHAELPLLGNHVLMATDAAQSMGFNLTTGNNMHISLEPESREETKRIFDALSVDGQISMPLQDMFFGAYFGTFTDRYGINWMLSYTEPSNEE